MRKPPQNCSAGFSVVVFWMSGPTASGRSRRARHERRAGGVQMRNSSAERSRPLGGSGGKSASSRKGVLALHGLLPDPRGSVGAAQPPGLALQASFTEIPVEGADCPPKTPVCPQGRAVSEKKELPTKTVNSSEMADCPAKKPALRRACVSGDCPRGEVRAFSARFPGRPALRA